jgi:hypothetical protein
LFLENNYLEKGDFVDGSVRDLLPGLLISGRPGVVVPEVGDADTLHPAIFIEVVDDPVGHDVDITLLPRLAGRCRGVLEGMELGVELDEEKVAHRHEVAEFQELFSVLLKCLIVGDELVGAVQRHGRSGRSVGIIEVLDGDVRREVVREGVIALVVEMVHVLKILLPVHGRPPYT